MKDIKISPPWFMFYKEVCELFKKDKDIVPVYIDENKELILKVRKYEKAKALEKIIPKEKKFGNVTVTIKVEYTERKMSVSEAFKVVFENNPAFKYVFNFETGSNMITYVVFEKEVVQFWNDDMSDPHGITSTLYQNIANDIFDVKGVVYSTDSDKNNNWTEKYFKTHATPEEIGQWELYNGKGSFGNGSKVVENKTKPIQVKDKNTFKSIFCYKKQNEDNEEYPFPF